MKKILIIEDDPAIRISLTEVLETEHYLVESEEDGEEGLTRAIKGNFDLIILDMMLPGKNGNEICSELRKEGNLTPVIILTSRKDEIDKVLALEMGADDYITKPFSIKELLARMKAVLRRSAGQNFNHEKIIIGETEIDFTELTAIRNGENLKLSPTEFKLLQFFLRNEARVISREKLLDEVWGYENYPTTRTIDNFILSLRKKFEKNPAEPVHFITVHSAGYKFLK
ncbi:MAG: response regulator transcription factor [Ignavibacteriaceae bacterium]|nr:response regulator transcription factor [Ignavibacteriaceae bacterium]